MVAVFPCFAIILYSGVEQRRHLIEEAESDVLMLVTAMAQSQRDITLSAKEVLSTLSQFPAIQAMESDSVSSLFRGLLEQNQFKLNLSLIDLNGQVFASGKPFSRTNLADRKHFKEALKENDSAAGEYLVTRMGELVPSFAFAYPVRNKEGEPKAILATVLNLDVFSRIFDVKTLPKKSFLSVTDNKGIRLFYYPAQEETNPIGKPIQAEAWNRAKTGDEKGLFFATGSDGLRRIIAYEKLYLDQEDVPYLYVWAGIPEDYILHPANTVLIRNFLLLFLLTLASLLISWLFSRYFLITPIQQLVSLAQEFAQGNLAARNKHTANSGEIGTLIIAFHNMADALSAKNKQLHEREQRFRTVADFAHDCEYWIDPGGKFLYLSPSCERITGYTPDEILDQPCLVLEMVSSEYEGKIRSHYVNGNKADAPFHTTVFPIINKSGKEVWLEHNCIPVFDDKGNYAGRRGNNRDITDQKRVESEKEQLEQQCIQAQKMESVGRLAGGVAHDFNNMLGVILGHAEIAIDELDIDHPIKNDLLQIQQAANRSSDITRQLLTFARKQIASPKVIDLNETVSGMVKMLLRLIGEDIDLAWLPGKGLWQVNVDPSQIDQILVNLCINARDAIQGGGKITVKSVNCTLGKEYCSTHAGSIPGQYVKIEVSDNGSGIDKEIVPHIFEPFFTTKGINEGTGLGLATVYGIVKQNNGFIYVYSEQGKGTTFSIYFPRYVGTTKQEQLESATEPVLGGNETILLVEDEQTILNMIAKLLHRLGYTVLIAGSPSEAIRLADKHFGGIDLLLTDVIMSEMNGRILMEKLTAKQPGIKCLYMSGYTTNVISHHGVLDEGVNFIQKPFTRKDLAEKIRQILGSREKVCN